MKKIFFRFSGDAKIGIFRKAENAVEFDPRPGIAMLIDRNKLPFLEDGKVYSISSPRFRILEKCVILDGVFKVVSESDCDVSRNYAESIYLTHPVRIVKVQYSVALTRKVFISLLGQVEELRPSTDDDRKEVVKEEVEYEQNPLPVEYQWMFEKICEGKQIFKHGDIYVSQDEGLNVVDARIVRPYYGRMAEYEIKTNLPVYEISYRKHDEEWQGQRLFHLEIAKLFSDQLQIINPTNGVVKIVTSFQDDEPKKEESLLTDESRNIDDGEMPSGFSRAMNKIAREHHCSDRGNYSYSSKPERVDINRSGNVAIVEFWGRKYAVAFDWDKYIDHLVTTDADEMNRMIREREERIQKETLENERGKLIAGVKGESIDFFFSEYNSYPEREAFTKQIEFKFPFGFNYNGEEKETGLYLQLQTLRVQTVEVLETVTSLEELEEVKQTYIFSGKGMEDVYNKGKKMIQDFSNLFDEILKQNFIHFSNEVHEIYKEINALESIACDGDLEKISKAISGLKQKVKKFPNFASPQKRIMEVEGNKNLLKDENCSFSNGIMAEALRKAGLIF